MKYFRKKRKWISIMVPVVALLLGGCGIQQSEKLSCTDTAMGTIVQQTLYVRSDMDQAGVGQDIPREVMSLLVSLEIETLSWREKTSEVYQINQSDETTGYPLSDKMQKYLECVDDVWKKSEGALDVTLGSVTRLWDIDGRALGKEQGESGAETDGFKIPDRQMLQEVLNDTGFGKVKIADGRIYMPAQMKFDLGAVGKGIACDEVLALLSGREAVEGAVISIGGSILTYGEKPDGNCWKVAIQHPRMKGESIAVLQLRGNWCISTSGDYERYVEENGERYHHIMDPKTGYPADSGLISVTIVSKSGILSDALSTACFILGKDAGLSLCEAYGVQAYMVDRDLNVYMTEGMDKLLILR